MREPNLAIIQNQEELEVAADSDCGYWGLSIALNYLAAHGLLDYDYDDDSLEKTELRIHVASLA